MMKRILSFLLVITLMAPLHQSVAYADEEGLAIGVEIKTGDSGNSDVGATRNLWMAIRQGNSLARDFIVVGSPKYDLRIIPEIHQMLFVNDQATYSSELSPLNDWVDFQEQYANGFIVKADKKKKITMVMTPPSDIPDAIYNAYLVVRVEAVDKQGEALSSVEGASVPIRAQLATPLWLGVGNPRKYRPNFRINDVAGVKYEGKKYLRVYAQNDGRSPIAPTGRVQLKNLDFDMPTQGPFEFYTFGVKAQTPFSFDVEVSKAVTPGRWSIYTEIRQGNYIITKTLKKQIKFMTVDELNRENADTSAMGLSQYSNLIFPVIGIVLVLLAFWRMQASNRRLKRELSVVSNRAPDDSI